MAHWKELAVIGRATHAMVYAELSATKFDPQDYTPRQIDRAENGFIKFLDWLKGHKVEARRILNIGRDETEDFLEEVRVGQPKEDEVWILTCLREIWAAEARLRKEKD